MGQLYIEMLPLPERESSNMPKGQPWKVFVDSSSCQASRGVGIYVLANSGQEYHYATHLAFKIMYNKAYVGTNSRPLSVE